MADSAKLHCKITLSAVDHAEALSQTKLRHDGEPHPLRWQSFLHLVSQGGVSTFDWRGAEAESVFMSWAPLRETIVAAILGRKLAYLAWGVAHFSGWRRQIVRFILSRSTSLLVNDEITGLEVERLAGRKARLIPYLVDTDFYQLMPLAGRKDYLFCPGSNDRDPELLVSLARRGEEIVWLNNDAELSAKFAHASPNLKIVSRPSYAALRTLYQQARACILPLAKDVHAAGQTTALEAMACGTPVFVTEGRTASIFSTAGVVQSLASNRAEDWASALATLPDQAECVRRQCYVEAHHSVEPVARSLSDALRADFPELRG